MPRSVESENRLVLACNLNAISAGDRTRYTYLFKLIQAAITDRRELPDGYVFRLEAVTVRASKLGQEAIENPVGCVVIVFQEPAVRVARENNQLFVRRSQ